MTDGSEEAGDDAVVGRTNFSNARTRLIATEHGSDPDDHTPYELDFVLEVAIENGELSQTGHALDAIHATGTYKGNGVVASGLNGLVGYSKVVPRDQELEGTLSGRGVLGIGYIGVAGIGSDGAGALARGIGVQGFGGLFSAGVDANGGPAHSGIVGDPPGKAGPGVDATGGSGLSRAPGGQVLQSMAPGGAGVSAEGGEGGDHFDGGPGVSAMGGLDPPADPVS